MARGQARRRGAGVGPGSRGRGGSGRRAARRSHTPSRRWRSRSSTSHARRAAGWGCGSRAIRRSWGSVRNGRHRASEASASSVAYVLSGRDWQRRLMAAGREDSRAVGELGFVAGGRGSSYPFNARSCAWLRPNLRAPHRSRSAKSCSSLPRYFGRQELRASAGAMRISCSSFNSQPGGSAWKIRRETAPVDLPGLPASGARSNMATPARGFLGMGPKYPRAPSRRISRSQGSRMPTGGPQPPSRRRQ